MWRPTRSQRLGSTPAQRHAGMASIVEGEAALFERAADGVNGAHVRLRSWRCFQSPNLIEENETLAASARPRCSRPKSARAARICALVITGPGSIAATQGQGAARRRTID